MRAPAVASPLERLPWTRARATRAWLAGFAALAALRLVFLAALPAFTPIRARDLYDELALAVVFPALFLGVVAFCEKRFLRRPPKGVLAAQLVFFCAGAALQAISLAAHPQAEPFAYAVLSGSSLLLGGWFLGVLLVPEG